MGIDEGHGSGQARADGGHGMTDEGRTWTNPQQRPSLNVLSAKTMVTPEWVVHGRVQNG